MFKEAEIPKPQGIEKKVSDWNERQPGYENLSIKERQFFYWVNYSRKNPRKFFDSVVKPIVDVYPQLKGDNLSSLQKDLNLSPSLPLLSLYDKLNQMAAFHAQDITQHKAKPSHNSTNGETFADRFKRSGLGNCGGENLSYGAGYADPLLMLVLLYLDINVADLGHRKALLNPNFIHTGISVSFYDDGNVIIVEDFACAQK
jgi:hypothetical protein